MTRQEQRERRARMIEAVMRGEDPKVITAREGLSVSALSMAMSRMGLSVPEQFAKARMSAAKKAALADPEVRARMSAAKKAAWADPEVRARMSAAKKAALADPEVRARMSAATRAAWADPEVRARMSAAWAAKREALFAGSMDEVCDDMRARGAGIIAISQRLGVSPDMLRRRLDERGVLAKPRRRPRRAAVPGAVEAAA